jgi:putative ABC transport system substrate-binding protein
MYQPTRRGHRRRDLIALLGGAAVAWPFIARAQQKAMPVIGILDGGSGGPMSSPFRQGLRETGYVEGQNVAFEHRWAMGRYDRLPELAAELVALNVDVIVTAGGTVSARAAKHATSTIPIVFSTGGDPVESGLVVSYARPGGNLTGVSIMATALDAKRLELVSELAPHATVIAALVNLNDQAFPQQEELEEAARARGIQFHVLRASSESEIDEAF